MCPLSNFDCVLADNPHFVNVNKISSQDRYDVNTWTAVEPNGPSAENVILQEDRKTFLVGIFCPA